MSNLPEGWAVCSVGEYFRSFGGGTPDKGTATYWGGTIPWLSSGDIKCGRIRRSTDYITQAGLDNSSAKLGRQGSVVVVVRSGILKHTLPVAILDIDASINQDIKCFDSGNNEFNEWLALALQAAAHDILALNREGTTVQSVKYETLTNFRLRVPPTPEQRRIVAKLEALLDKIRTAQERLDKIPTLLKRFRQSVLTAACTGRLTADWRATNRQGDTAEDLLAAIRRSSPSLGVNRPENWQRQSASEDIPSSWLRCCLSQLFSVQTGATPLKTRPEYHTNGTIPWVKTGEVQNCDILEAEQTITQLAVVETNAKLFPAGTLLIAMYGEGKTRGQVGRLRIKAATNQACAALVNPHLPSSTNEYVFYYCLTQYHRLRAEAVGGNQPNLNLGIIKQWVINLPPLDEQAEIVRRISSFLRLADGLEARYLRARAQVEKVSQSALALAFRGGLVPTEAELARQEDRAFETATELLKRIAQEDPAKVDRKTGSIAKRKLAR